MTPESRTLPEDQCADAALEDEARRMVDSPIDYFEGSLTKMQSLPWPRLQAMQRIGSTSARSSSIERRQRAHDHRIVATYSEKERNDV